MQWERPHTLFATSALTHQGWQSDVLITIDDTGHISDITTNANAPKDASTHDILLPGIANVHSHAFQRAMAGLTERAHNDSEDNFWSWRQVMYQFKERLTPEHIEIIATQLYIDLLKQGYTNVGEFHYLHHDSDGTPYTNRAETSERIMAAAIESGIHLTLLPVYYETSGFGGTPADERQARFTHDIDHYIRLLEQLAALQKHHTHHMHLGIAPHSLRAVPPESLQQILSTLPSLELDQCPIHIHIAEQQKEINDCIEWSQKRPVTWLLDNTNINEQWCLIHATHIDTQEITRITQSNATVGLCPTTEANLGDGIFPITTFTQANGRFAIGSDSHVCLSPWEEMRLLEYTQRLIHQKRTLMTNTQHHSTGRFLFNQVTESGAQALGVNSGVIAIGKQADLIAITQNTPAMTGKKGDQILDTIIFSTPSAPITHVWVKGQCVIQEGIHQHEEKSADKWQQMMHELLC